MFNIKINTLEQEFERVKETIFDIPFFMKNYGEIIARLPANEDKSEPEFITQMKEGLDKASKTEEKEWLKEFKKYNRTDVLESVKADVEKSFEEYKNIDVKQIFETLNKNWGFKIFPEYDVILTYYGTGGSYKYKDGRIILRHKRELSRPYFYTIFHEAVHIGIEENIVKKYNLSQAEKESVVDAICGNYLMNYGLQNLTIEDKSGLYKFLIKDRGLIEKDLVGLIEKYCFSSRKGDAK